MQRSGQKRDKKNRWGRRQEKGFFPLNFFDQKPKVCDMDFPLKVSCGVFELLLLKNAQKRHFKKKYLPTPFSGHLPDTRRLKKNWAPLEKIEQSNRGTKKKTGGEKKHIFL
jgi:hypothetical protein